MDSTTSASQMTQLNLRVNKRDKRQAEEVLHLMGTTTTEFVRKLLAKVARGAKEYEEVKAVLDASAEDKVKQEEAGTVNPIAAKGWTIVDDFCKSLGYASADDVPRDTRSWEEIYEEAMTAHYEEKGWLS